MSDWLLICVRQGEMVVPKGKVVSWSAQVLRQTLAKGCVSVGGHLHLGVGWVSLVGRSSFRRGRFGHLLLHVVCFRDDDDAQQAVPILHCPELRASPFA